MLFSVYKWGNWGANWKYIDWRSGPQFRISWFRTLATEFLGSGGSRRQAALNSCTWSCHIPFLGGSLVHPRRQPLLQFTVLGILSQTRLHFCPPCAVDPRGTPRWCPLLFKMTSASFLPLAATFVPASWWNCGFFQPKLREDSGQPWKTQHTSCLDLPMTDTFSGPEKEEILKARCYLSSVFNLKKICGLIFPYHKIHPFNVVRGFQNINNHRYLIPDYFLFPLKKLRTH